MASTFSFADRFSYPSPNGITPEISHAQAKTLTAAQVESASDELKEMAEMVRIHSVVLRGTSAYDIYKTIVTIADPAIALMLAAAKSKIDNTPLFAGVGSIKEIMYADPNRSGATGLTNRQQFSDGLRYASALWTASVLTGALAQVKEQLDHSKTLLAEAKDCVNRIIQTWDIESKAKSGSEGASDDESAAAFYFESTSIFINEDEELYVAWQSAPSEPQWTEVGIYTESLDVWQLVSAIADDINYKTSHSDDGILSITEMSGPILNSAYKEGVQQYHTLSFFPRRATPNTIAFSLNIKIETRPRTGLTVDREVPSETPFLWGTRPGTFKTYPVNGALVISRNNRVSNIKSELEVYQPTVFYFRRKVGEPVTDSKFAYKVQPMQTALKSYKSEDGEVLKTIEVDFTRTLGEDQDLLDADCFSGVAFAFLNSLADASDRLLLTGALLRNDPPTPNALAAVEVVCWTSSFDSVVVDFVEVPPFIELAVGNVVKPLTFFSSKPRSVIVKNSNSASSGFPTGEIPKAEASYAVRRKRSKLWQSIKDEASIIEQGYHF